MLDNCTDAPIPDRIALVWSQRANRGGYQLRLFFRVHSTNTCHRLTGPDENSDGLDRTAKQREQSIFYLEDG